MFDNSALWTALLATVVAQVFKVLLVLLTERRWAFDRMLETGGMPSSHSAAVTSLATGMGFSYGWDSPYFALAAVFGSIVMYDATGIRRAAGMQAELLNELVQELADVFDEGFQPQALKTLLGHTYPQVIVGAILGIVTGVVVFL
ncbi:MAG: divergent PAP2 family protein [Trueperaceae bacterium]|nr:divergent PAP2 family protein [Trueperaceae bacterium]